MSTEARQQDEVKQAWGQHRKLTDPKPEKKRGKQRGKNMCGSLLIALIANTARDAGLVIIHRSEHRRSFYLKRTGSQFKLRISDHKYSGWSQQRHMSVILNHVVKGNMDSQDAIALGKKLAADYVARCDNRLRQVASTPLCP